MASSFSLVGMENKVIPVQSSVQDRLYQLVCQCKEKFRPILFDFRRLQNPASTELVKSIENFIVSFSLNTTNSHDHGKSVQEFYKNAEKTIRNHKLWADQDVDSAMEGLEKYIMTKLFSQTFSSPEDAEIDLEISQKMHLLNTFLKPEHLEISEFLCNETSLYYVQ